MQHEISDTFPERQREVRQALDGLLAAIHAKDADRLESFHLYGPKFTKFDDFEPLERVDAERCRALEREGISKVEEVEFRVEDLKVDVFGRVAITTFLLHENMSMDGERVSALARSTLVWVLDGERWRITHEHFSPFKANP